MTGKVFVERRDSVRVRRIVTVRHRIYRRAGKKINEPWQLSTTQDMSFSGLLFTSVVVYQPEDVLELQVVMSGVLFLFNGFGKVVRVAKQKNAYYQVGIKYIDLKSRNRNAKSLLPARQKTA